MPVHDVVLRTSQPDHSVTAVALALLDNVQVGDDSDPQHIESIQLLLPRLPITLAQQDLVDDHVDARPRHRSDSPAIGDEQPLTDWANATLDLAIDHRELDALVGMLTNVIAIRHPSPRKPAEEVVEPHDDPALADIGELGLDEGSRVSAAQVVSAPAQGPSMAWTAIGTERPDQR